MVAEPSAGVLTSPTYRVRVLGPFALERDDALVDTDRWQRRVASLFKLLATAPECRRLRDEVVELLWPDAAPEAGGGNLRILTHRLRLALGSGEPSPVLAEGGWVVLNPMYSWEVDLHRFEELAQRAGDDVSALEEAVRLYGGEPLVEERYQDWAIPIRERVQRTWREVCLLQAAACRTRAADDQAIRAIERVLESDPIDEEALRELLTVLYETGRPADALRRYQQFEQRLAEELGVPPAAETTAVVRRLHAQFAPPPSEGMARSRSLPIGEFLGALPEGLLLGREEELERILVAVNAVEKGTGQPVSSCGRLVLVTGERGVGKTRIAQEVMLRLRDRGFVVATGRCDEREQPGPLSPVLQAVRGAYVTAPPSVRLQTARLWQELGQLVPALVDAAPDVGSDTRAPDGMEGDARHHLFRAVTSFVAGMAGERPVGLLLDDLHRADEMSLQLMQHLARQARGHRMFLLATYRDDDIERESPREYPVGQAVRELAQEGLGEPGTLWVSLRRLSPEATAALVDATVGQMDASEEFTEFVYRRTKGNPFYIDKMLQSLGGRYCLLRQIGAGGMGRVFEAVDRQTGQAVAAKIMFARKEANPRALLRFEQEGAVLASLDHPNIVEVYGTFLEEHANCIIMELVDGQSLAQLLRQPEDSQRLPLDRVKHITQQVTAALTCAHQHGIVHRDVKPDNIMIAEGHPEGIRVKVTDFGIARLVRPRRPLTTLTTTGMTMGTPLYMAPEQIEGKKVDGRADIYSLGAVLYELVTGRPPFEGEDPLSVAFRHVHERPRPPREINPELPEDWERLILTALEKDPADRFATAAEMEAALSRLGNEGTEPVPRRPVQEIEGSLTGTPDEAAASFPSSQPVGEVVGGGGRERSRRRRRLGIGLPAGAAVCVAVAVALLVLGRGETKPRAQANRGAPTQYTGSNLGQFRGPQGVAVDPNGLVYVVDEGNNRVQILSPDGTPLNWFARKGRGSDQLRQPAGVAIGPHGNIYVADVGNSRIQKFSPGGIPLDTIHATTTGRGLRDLGALTNLVVDRTKHVYATDTFYNRVIKFTVDGTFLGTWGSEGKAPGRFRTPTGIAVDAGGHVYVADRGNARIQIFSPEGRLLRSWGRFGLGRGEMDAPSGVAVDTGGNVYVADAGNSRIEKFTADGRRLLATFGGRGTGPGRFIRLSGIAVDRHGYVYATDYSRNRVQKFSPTGKPLWATRGAQSERFHPTPTSTSTH